MLLDKRTIDHARILLALLAILTVLARSSFAELGKASLSRVKNSSVLLLVREAGNGGKVISSGSGFVVSKKGLIVTCHHVVADEFTYENWRGDKKTKRRNIGRIQAVSGSGTEEVEGAPARVVAQDPQNDLALLKVDGQIFDQHLTLKDDSKLSETQNIWCFGYPLGEALAEGESGPAITVTQGQITSLRRKNDRLQQVQTDVSVTGGNSGGPVVDADGSVIGVIYLKIGRDSGINYAIPAWKVQRLIKKYRSDDSGKKVTEDQLDLPEGSDKPAPLGTGDQAARVELGWDKMPEDFTGTTASALVKAVGKAMGEKDKFETKFEHKKRVAEKMQNFSFADVSPGDYIGFVYEPESRSDTDSSAVKPYYTYDAAKQSYTMVPFIQPSGYFPDVSGKPFVLPMGVDVEERSTYVVSNAFGAKVKVTKLRDIAYVVMCQNIEKQLELSWDVRPKTARKIDPHIAFVYVCRLKPPYLMGGLWMVEPDMSTPYDIKRYYAGVNVEVVELWVIRSDTRDILKKYAAANSRSPRRRPDGDGAPGKAVRRALMMARNYALNGLTDKACGELKEVIKEHPEASGIEKAKQYLEELRAEVGSN